VHLASVRLDKNVQI